MASAARRLLHALLLGLLGAAIVHILLLLMLPGFARNDAWARVSGLGQNYQFVRLKQDVDGALLAGTDPMFEAALCRFDLLDGVVHVTVKEQVPFWSAAVFDRRGRVVYSLTDRTAAGGPPDIVLASPAQLLEMRKAMPEQFANSVFIESGLSEGMLLLRGFVPDPTWRPTVERFLNEAACTSG